VECAAWFIFHCYSSVIACYGEKMMKILRDEGKEDTRRGMMIGDTNERNRKGIWEKEGQEIRA
jgi:hypothetical protein